MAHDPFRECQKSSRQRHLIRHLFVEAVLYRLSYRDAMARSAGAVR